MSVAIALHGFVGDPAVWDGVAPDGVHALALPGHRGGPAVAPTWDANLDAVLAHADLERVDLAIGYSLGARVALGLLATGRARRAILIGVNPGLADPAERAARAAADATWIARLRTRPLAEVLDAWEAQPIFATQARFPERVAARRARRLAHDPHALADNLAAMGLAAMPDLRAAVDDRAVLIAGALDAKFTALHATLAARAHHAIADSGHDPTLEQPAALAALLRDLAAE